MNFPPFRPHPLFRSGHAQTIAGAYLPGAKYGYQAARHFVDLPDGDRIVLHDDVPQDWQTGGRIALLIHGLGGCHESGYMRRIAHRLSERGVRALRMDLRGWGAGADCAIKPFHAACWSDIAVALEAIKQQHPTSPVSLIGFSLGANIQLRLLGELGDALPGNVDSALAVAPPVDLLHCSQNLGRGFGKVYDYNYARFLWSHLQSRTRQVAGYASSARQRRPRNIWEFDERFTAPLGGFDSVEDYYAAASSAAVLARVKVPTLILAAADDPIVPLSQFKNAKLADAISLHVTDHGGHLGYLAARGDDPDRRWMDWRIVDWAKSLPNGLERSRTEQQRVEAP